MSKAIGIFTGTVWNLLEKTSVQVIQLFIGIVLARLLTPTEFGDIAILLVFINFFQLFVDFGFSKALIQKQEKCSLDYNTVFHFSLIVGICCYILIWALAPHIAMLFNSNELLLPLRVLSLTLITNSIFIVPNTILIINHDFGSIARINIFSIILSGILATLMAYNGYGIWSLVWQSVFRSGFLTLSIFVITKWSPSREFSITSLKSFFSFGSQLFYASILNVTTNNIASLLISKSIGTKELGLYSRGSQFADTPFNLFSSIIDSIFLPYFSKFRNQRDILIKYSRASFVTTGLIAVPLFVSLAILADPLVRLLLPENWFECIPILQIICIARLISVFSSINVNLLYVLGRTDLVLKQQIGKLIIRIIILLISFPFGIYYIAFGELISTCIHFFINSYYPGKIIHYSGIDQIKDLGKVGISGFAMITALMILKFLKIPVFFYLFLSIVVGIVTFYSMVIVVKVNEFNWLIHAIKYKLRAYYKGN